MANQKAIKFLNLNDNVVLKVNKALGRTPELLENGGPKECKWMDAKSVYMPTYLSNAIIGQYRPLPLNKVDDIILKNFLDGNDSSSENLRILTDITSRLRDIVLSNVSSDNSDRRYSAGLHRSYISELDKQQVLTHSPVFGHALAAGGHPVHEHIPTSFSLEEKDSYELGNTFRNLFLTSRYHDFTMPASTSQGLTLKTAQDTPQWRIYSKALLGNLALKCSSFSDYQMVISSLNKCFTDKGFDPIADCFYLGMRKQGMRKEEPITSDYAVYGGGDQDVSYSRAIQGRIRGIFPPSEFVKVYFKPFAEGIKKDLFTKSAVCCVNLNYISCKLHAIALLSEIHFLFDEDGGYLCFYDLSKMDTTTHYGFFKNYKEFCRGIFPDFDIIEGDLMESCDLIFPNSPLRSGSMIRQQVKSRSTLSGQPDVTTKNNVCHLLAMVHALSLTTGQDKQAVLKCLLTGEKMVGWEHEVVAHMHGDDTMLYFSDNVEDYKSYYSHLKNLGFDSTFEDTPIFLKKTPAYRDLDVKLINDGVIKSLISLSHDILRSISSMGETDATGDDICAILDSAGIGSTSTDYNKRYMGALNASAASLIKNRWGEYVIKDACLIMMSLHDTAKMINTTDLNGEWIRYWYFLYNLSIPDADDPSHHLFDFTTKSDNDDALSMDMQELTRFHSWLTSESKATAIRDVLMALAEGSATKAKTIRNALERMYYAGGQELTDSSIATLFGSLELRMDQLGDSFDITKLSLKELIDLVTSLQGEIIERNGMVPNMHEDIFRTASKIFSNLGSLSTSKII